MGIFSDILLTVDFDRTLTAPDSTIPERNIEAIRYFIEHGGTFTVNTGRSLPMIRNYIDIIPHNAPLLLYNGSSAYENGGLTQSHPIELDMTQTLNRVVAQFPELTLEVQGVDAHYCFGENPGWEKYSINQKCAYAFASTEDDLGPFLKFALYGTFHEPTVAHLFQGTSEEIRRMDEAEAWLRETFAGIMEVFRPAARIIDVHARGVSKLRSARELQARLGKRLLVCVGDAENDVPMLDGADHAYCPADGAVADRYETVCNCADGAVADVIYKKIPEIL